MRYVSRRYSVPGQRDWLAVDEHLAAAQVHGQAVALVDPALVVPVHRLVADRLHSFDHLSSVEGPHEEAVNAQHERLRDEPVRGAAGKQDDRRVGQLSQPLDQRPAVNPRYAQIEHHGVRAQRKNSRSPDGPSSACATSSPAECASSPPATAVLARRCGSAGRWVCPSSLSAGFNLRGGVALHNANADHTWF